jgi:hypothetical protein
MPSTRASTRASKSQATPTPPPTPTPTSYTLKGLQASETYKIPSSRQPLKDYDPIEVVFCLLWEKGTAQENREMRAVVESGGRWE